MYFHQIIYKIFEEEEKSYPWLPSAAHQGSLKQNRPKTNQNASHKARKKLRISNA